MYRGRVPAFVLRSILSTISTSFFLTSPTLTPHRPERITLDLIHSTAIGTTPCRVIPAQAITMGG